MSDPAPQPDPSLPGTVRASQLNLDVTFGPAAPATPFTFEVPAERYASKREHARGGMGRILIAADRLMEREVAIKEILAPGAGASSADLERFLREARITAQLEHPNIVPVHEIGRNPDGSLFYTMKLVRGETLAQRLDAIAADRSLTPGEALARRLRLLDAFTDVCQAVAYAHSRGVVNRDLKPANVMMGEYGETLVLDWGLARARGVADAAAERLPATRRHETSPVTGSSQLTLEGDVMGTPAYMSPEQAEGRLEEVDEKSDVFSLGAILYEILTGFMPHQHADMAELMKAVRAARPIPVLRREPEAPRELAALVERAMEPDRGKRLESAKRLAEEVTAFRDGRALSVYRYSAAEQFRRFVKRNRALSGSLAALFVVLSAGIAVSTTFARRSSANERDAREAQGVAERAQAAAQANAEAERAARLVAEGQFLAAAALHLADSQPGLAVLLGLEAAEHAPGPAANTALVEALSNLAERRRFVLSSGPATAVAVSPDGRFLAAGGADGRIAVFEAASGRELWREEAHAGAVTGLSFAPGGNRCVSWGADRAVRLWTAEYRIGVSSPPRGPLATRLEGLEAPVRDASFDAAGTRVLVVLESRAPVVWTPGSSTRIALAGGADRATAARWSPDGEVIATAHPDGFARLQDPASGAEMRKFDMSRSPVLDVAWSGDGRWLFACAANGAVLKWNSGGAWSGTFSLDVRPDVARVHVHPKDGRVAVATGQRGVFEVRVFAPDGNGLARVGPFSSLPLPCDDWRRFASTDGADLVLRDASAKLSPERLRGHVSAVRALAADADGRTLASASEDGTAALWAAGMERAVVPVLAPAALGHVVYYADGARALATPSLDDPPKLVDIRTGSEIPGWEPAERVPVHRSADPTGRRIVAFFDQGPACLLDAATGKVIAQWEPEGRTRRGVAWSPAGRRFLFYSPDSGDVRSAEDGSRLETIVFDGGGVAEAIVPDGLPVAAWTVTEKTLGAFGPGVNASESPTPLREIGAPPAHLALHPENGLVLTESNGAVTRWHDRSRAPVRISWPRNEETLPRFSPDGRFLLLCGVGGGVLLMRGDSLELVLSLQPDRATEAIFLADGRRFLAWNRDRAAIYPLDPAEAARAAKPRELTDAERRRFRVLAQGK